MGSVYGSTCVLHYDTEESSHQMDLYPRGPRDRQGYVVQVYSPAGMSIVHLGWEALCLLESEVLCLRGQTKTGIRAQLLESKLSEANVHRVSSQTSCLW